MFCFPYRGPITVT